VKLAFVVQRFGSDVVGGSEAHCRAFARQLSARHDITVLTSCARDYVTWANAYPPGPSLDNGVTVLRFPVARQRRLKTFADLSDEVLDGDAPLARQDDWFRENGPECPLLLDHLRVHGRTYDLVLFWTFRYAPSYFGVPIVADRAVLVPTAEEDRVVDLGAAARLFRRPSGFLFLTPEEQALVASRAGGISQPAAVVGTGLARPAGVSPDDSAALLRSLAVPSDYVLYLGRVDRNKGCATLFEYFQQYTARVPGTTLVVAGPGTLPLPRHPHILGLGYVSDELRQALVARAGVLVVPSRYESLSLVLLEAWNHGVPALVNARCRVLHGQVRRANGGLFYRSADEFVEALDYLITHEDARQAFGRQGRAYVEREYRWPTVLAKVEALLERVRESARGR
jgi:glycosyltransferase involved in cell wall biosynthesis